MLPASLRIPAFRRLLAANTLSVIGSLMTFVVLPIVAWEATGSSATFAFVLAGGALGMLVAMPFGGVIADRFDRRRVLLVGDACAMVVMSIMFVAVEAGAWWSLPFVEFAATFLGSLFVAAGPALRRDVLTDEVRTQGTALHSAGHSTANLVAPMLGGTIYAFAGFGAVVAADVATFAISFMLILGMRTTCTGATAGQRPEGRRVVLAVLDDVRAGIVVARDDPFMRRVLAGRMFAGFANGLVLVAIVPWFDVVLGMPPEYWGGAMATMGGAGLLGALAMTRIGERVPTGRVMTLGAACFLLGSLGLVGEPTVGRLFVAFALIGCTNSMLGVSIATSIQRRVASSFQGRVNSLLGIVQQASQLVSTLGAGLFLATSSPATMMLVSITCFSLAALWFLGAAGALVRAPTTFTEEQLSLGA